VSPGVQQGEVIAFMKNIALMGCMLFLLANGTGPWSLDNRGQNAAGDSADDDE
jgi:putative oxidoreductase